MHTELITKTYRRRVKRSTFPTACAFTVLYRSGSGFQRARVRDVFIPSGHDHVVDDQVGGGQCASSLLLVVVMVPIIKGFSGAPQDRCRHG